MGARSNAAHGDRLSGGSLSALLAENLNDARSPHPFQRLQMFHRRPYDGGLVETPEQPIAPLQGAVLLDRARQNARTREIRQPFCRRRPRRSGHLSGKSGPDPARRTANADRRSSAGRIRHGGGDAASGLWHHRRLALRAAVFVRAQNDDLGPSDRWPDRLEHRHLRARQRGAQSGPRRTDSARRALCGHRRVHGGRLQALGG